MKRTGRSLVFAVVAAILGSVPAGTAWAGETEWDFEIGAYLWAMGIEGDLNVGGRNIEIDASFSDYQDMMEFGGGLLMRAEKSSWVLWAQTDYLALNTDKLDNSPAIGRLDSDSFIFTAGVGRNFTSADGRRSIDVLIGARYLELENRLRLNGIGTFNGDRSFTDPIIILRPSFQISERWRLNPTFSYGGGDSESTYELQPQIQFQMTPSTALRFGYRIVGYDIENSSNGNGFDGSFQGFLIGISGTFSSGAESAR
jgi:hypothetical protein